MGDYTEHLISMAGGDGEDALDQIQRRRKNHEPCTAEVCGSRVCQTARDRDYLLALVREQAAQIERVRELAEASEPFKLHGGYTSSGIVLANDIFAALTATDLP